MHNLHASDVNAYIKTHMGEEFTAKDFRTWGDTLLATSAILKDGLEATAPRSARKKAVTRVAKLVAARLDNTPAIARTSYIDPRGLAAYDDDVTPRKARRAMNHLRPNKYLSLDEQCVLKLLSK